MKFRVNITEQPYDAGTILEAHVLAETGSGFVSHSAPLPPDDSRLKRVLTQDFFSRLGQMMEERFRKSQHQDQQEVAA